MRFEWDEAKSKSNLRKHRVSFETAMLAFKDPNSLTEQDREIGGEVRWRTIGMVDGQLILFVAHTVVEREEEIVRIISARKASQPRGGNMKKSRIVSYTLEPGTPLTAKQKKEIKALSKMKDSEIDLSDIPELPASAWKNAVRGEFYRPVKKAVSLRLDADVIAWLKKDGEGYQTRANRLLRERMLADKAS